MKRFLPLLVPIILLLIAIPFLLVSGMVVPAKVLGMTLVILSWIALRVWLRRIIRKKLSPDIVRFNANHRYFLNEISPVYRNMPKGEQKMLEKRMGKLISELQFDDTIREELSVEDILSYALIQIFSVYHEEFKSLKGLMIVFDQTNNTGHLTFSKGKYVLLNPVFIQNTLKEACSLDFFIIGNLPIIAELRKLYLETKK
jgi:hypothetical protein